MQNSAEASYHLCGHGLSFVSKHLYRGFVPSRRAGRLACTQVIKCFVSLLCAGHDMATGPNLGVFDLSVEFSHIYPGGSSC